MSRSRKKLIITVTMTVICSVLSVFLTSTMFDKATAPSSSDTSDSDNGFEDCYFPCFEVKDEETLASILGFNYGFEGATSVMFVKPVNLSRQAFNEEPEVYIFNSTDYIVNVDDYRNAEYPVTGVDLSSDEPVVLIVHTHGTEAFIEGEKEYYTSTDTFRNSDTEKNVVALGSTMAQRLNELGIRTLHDTRMHDLESFNQAYTNSYYAVKEYLEQYPSIRYVIDLHRDSIFSSTNENQKPVTLINSEKTAQIMIVVGSNQNGGHPNWKKNLALAVALQEKFNNYPTFSRPIYLRTANFNQQLSTGMLLLEVGSCANTLTEAKRAALLAADCFTELIKENSVHTVFAD